MDLVVADDRTVPYIYLLNIIVAEEDLKLMKNQKEAKKNGEAVGGRGKNGRMEARPFPWIQRHDPRINHIFVCTKCIIQWGGGIFRPL